MNINISIIIPTLHRKNSLIRLLKSFSKNDLKNTEVIVIEQGDNNRQAFLSNARKLKILLRYEYTDIHNTARAKNIGASKAKGNYLVFFDDDVIVHKNIIRNLIKDFKDPTIGCIGGRVLTLGYKDELGNQFVGRISSLGFFSDGFSSDVRQDIDTPIGCNMAFPTKIFRKTGGFDEQYTIAIREESDLSLKIKKLGYRVVFEPTAVVTHIREKTGGGRKSEGRLEWYFGFFSNETYFCLKHFNQFLLPIYLVTKTEWALRCMFGFGREVSFRSLVTPVKGILDGMRKYRYYKKNLEDS
jgi:GT2 family glycosyltransferase